jgi:hypothetical protein
MRKERSRPTSPKRALGCEASMLRRASRRQEIGVGVGRDGRSVSRSAAADGSGEDGSKKSDR